MQPSNCNDIIGDGRNSFAGVICHDEYVMATMGKAVSQNTSVRLRATDSWFVATGQNQYLAV